MASVSLTFPDGSVREYDAAMTGAELAESISKSLAKKAVAYAVDGTLRDLSDPLGNSGKVEIVTRDDPRALELIRHDVNLAIKLLRHEEGAPPVVMDPFNLQLQAQQWAEHTAVAGRQENSPRNVTMIQHNLPESEASGHAFVDAWLHSEAHTGVILDARYTFYGIGVAVGHGRVWVAVQYSA